ncbi:uncharacterized protein BHQ10_008432 [Talaromyces amestolkiae]|uniref:Aminoglycoside phosphotransferase domain-containing protein n=1 Tax=Talaromyces amestolkiae TaxID=1196081 RepID=A0A364L9C9_TALAM|nr:uncharacterized protein BHQ10_008432 [Talaromyces amestolkiae]RAO72420.1 hypothetical protein BHQ10_008432 [Talaromyces amestolkiae]
MFRYSLGDRSISLKLPDFTQQEVDFTDASFFSSSPDRHLPTPAQVRALSKDVGTCGEPAPIRFEDPKLIVKFGPSRHVTTTEAVNLWMIKKVFGDGIPVPELFGWRVDSEGYVFIYMELINGPTLQECWNQLKTNDKNAVIDQLSRITENLRKLKQDPSNQFIGSINNRPLLDYVFADQPTTGPFSSVKEFNDWFALCHQLRFERRYDDPNRCFLPDDGEVKLTHADLNRRNIILPSTNPLRIVVVDWQQSGWYPDYWEYCKATWTVSYKDEWREDYIYKYLQPREDVYDVFCEYTAAMGAF